MLWEIFNLTRQAWFLSEENNIFALCFGMGRYAIRMVREPMVRGCPDVRRDGTPEQPGRNRDLSIGCGVGISMENRPNKNNDNNVTTQVDAFELKKFYFFAR